MLAALNDIVAEVKHFVSGRETTPRPRRAAPAPRTRPGQDTAPRTRPGQDTAPRATPARHAAPRLAPPPATRYLFRQNAASAGTPAAPAEAPGAAPAPPSASPTGRRSRHAGAGPGSPRRQQDTGSAVRRVLRDLDPVRTDPTCEKPRPDPEQIVGLPEPVRVYPRPRTPRPSRPHPRGDRPVPGDGGHPPARLRSAAGRRCSSRGQGLALPDGRRTSSARSSARASCSATRSRPCAARRAEDRPDRRRQATRGATCRRSGTALYRAPEEAPPRRADPPRPHDASTELPQLVSWPQRRRAVRHAAAGLHRGPRPARLAALEPRHVPRPALGQRVRAGPRGRPALPDPPRHRRAPRGGDRDAASRSASTSSSAARRP